MRKKGEKIHNQSSIDHQKNPQPKQYNTTQHQPQFNECSLNTQKENTFFPFSFCIIFIYAEPKLPNCNKIIYYRVKIHKHEE